MPARNSKKYEVGDEVHVTWRDAVAKHGWNSRGESLHLHEIISTGFVVAVEDDRVTLASDLDRHGGGTGRVQSIPKGCIQNVTVRDKDCIDKGFYLRKDK